jgi:hypothetical protein
METIHSIKSIGMINPSRRRHMRSDATKLSSMDYEDIMQYRDMVSKPLDQLRKKYHISNSRLYQIWRGEEVGRVEWNYSTEVIPVGPVLGLSASGRDQVPLSHSGKNYIDRQDEIEIQSGSKAKRTAGKKTKFTRTSEPSRPQETSDNHVLNALYEKEAKRDEKNKINVAHLLTIQGKT